MKVTRYGVLVATLVLVLVASERGVTFGILTPDGLRQVASVVGMNVGVAENPMNRLAQEITERERDLDAREAAIKERETRAAEEILTAARAERQTTMLLLSGIASILFLLVGVNFYLDHMRLREREHASRDEEQPIRHNGELTTRL